MPLPDRTFRLYLLASATALAGDVAIFLGLLRLNLDAPLAASAGYVVGIIIHWYASTRLAFIGSRSITGSARHLAKTLFLVSAFAGLMTTCTVAVCSAWAGLDPLAAKAVAVAASFEVTYLLRRHIVFAT